MSYPNSLRKFGVILLVGLICGLLSWKAQPAALAGGPGSANAKIDPIILNQISASGAADFFLKLSEKADLSSARSRPSKVDKGRLVLEKLTETARRSQSRLRDFLDGRGINYQPYYIANLILVRQGDLSLLQELSARPEVARILPNLTRQVTEPLPFTGLAAYPGLPGESSQPESINPNLTFINADDVWGMGFTGQGTVLAGIDTGLDAQHPAIARHYRGCLNPPDCTEWDHNYSWWDAVGEYPDEPHDGNGHGTMTTGVMVGDDGGENQIGVAPGAKTIHCKAFTAGGSGTDADILECLQWILAPWDLTGANPDPAQAPDALAVTYQVFDWDQFDQDAYDALIFAGILVAPAAGGQGPGCATVSMPGGYPPLLTMGAVDGTGGILPGALSYFSGRGPSPDYPGDYFPDVIAPGIDIKSSYPGGTYQVWSGTSLATPHGTGLAGLCWSANPSLRGDLAVTIDLITGGAVPLSGEHYSNCGGDYEVGPNNDWGYGTIDALATVLACLPQGGTGALEGSVSDAWQQIPLAGATVSAQAEDGSGWDVFTNGSGVYSMTLPAGVYTVTATDPAYITSTVTGVEIITATTTTLDFDLEPAAPVTLTGFVMDANSDLPIEGALVDAAPGPEGMTGPDGAYTLPLIAGVYTLTASADGYYNQLVAGVEILTGTTSLDFALEPTFVPVTLTGQVSDALSLAPIQSAEVGVVSGPSTLTDPDGIYTLTLGAGTYTVTASAPGYIDQFVTDVEVISDTVIQDFALSPGISFAPYPVEMTLEWLDGGELPVTVTNQLDEPFDFTFSETPAGGVPGEDVLWLGQSPAGGTVQAGGSLTATLSFTATIKSGVGLPGDYTATLLVEGDSRLEIPVVLHATGEVITPTAAFTNTLPACPSPYTVQFFNNTDPGNPPKADYVWEFGDRESSTDINPYHQYDRPGEYEVSLQACNGILCDTISSSLDVLPLSTARFTYKTDHLTITFDNLSTSGESYWWEFGDGTYSTEPNPVHRYSKVGNYQVTLTVVGSCGNAPYSETVRTEGYLLMLPLLVSPP